MRNWITFSCLLLCSAVMAQTPATTWAPCKAPVEIASRAYQRIIEASGQPALQHERKTSFWDIFEFAHNCPEIRKIGDELARNGLDKKSTLFKGSSGSGSFEAAAFAAAGVNLPAGCTSNGQFVCRFMVTKPSSGAHEGMEAGVDWYLLDATKKEKIENPNFVWKELDKKSFKLPGSIQLDKK